MNAKIKACLEYISAKSSSPPYHLVSLRLLGALRLFRLTAGKKAPPPIGEDLCFRPAPREGGRLLRDLVLGNLFLGNLKIANRIRLMDFPSRPDDKEKIEEKNPPSSSNKPTKDDKVILLKYIWKVF